MGDINIQICVRYDGNFKKIPEDKKVMYLGGLMKTFFVEYDRTCLKDLVDEVMSTFNCFEKYIPKLLYLDATSTKRHKIDTDKDYMEFLKLHVHSKKCEIFLDWEIEGFTDKLREFLARKKARETSQVLGKAQVAARELVEEQVVREAQFTVEEQVAMKTQAVEKRQKIHASKSVSKKLFTEKGKSLDIETALEITMNEEPDMEKDDLDDCTSENTCIDYDSSDSDEWKAEKDQEVISHEGLISDVCVDNPIIEVGKTFTNSLQFRMMIKQHAIINNFEAKFVKNEKERWVVKCAAENCQWRVRAILHRQDGVTVEIRTMHSKHSCVGVNRIGNSQASAQWIADRIVPYIKNNRNFTPKEIGDYMRDTYQLENIPYNRMHRARDIAREMVYGNVDENYGYVPSLVGELLMRNTGSHIVYNVDVDGAFKRLFISFRSCVLGFKNGCRPFLGVDGCHLRSKFLGVLLSATALDGNNGLYPVAFAVVEGESSDSWGWFLENLLIALDGDVDNITIMSDMEKGLDEALKKIMPSIEHRVCMRHLWKSLKKSYPGDCFERLIWDIARAFTITDRNKSLNELREISEEAYNAVCNKGIGRDGRINWTWSRSTFRSTSKNHYITNNLSESFNSWILESRNLPVCDLVDNIRVKLIKKMELRRRQSLKWKGDLVPMAVKYLQDMSRQNNWMTTTRCGPYSYEVSDGNIRKLVDIENNTCSCRIWELTGLPCSHAMVVLVGIRNVEWQRYVHESFHLSRYVEAYKYNVAMLPSKEEWNVVELPYIVGPPHSKRPRGRPKRERIRGDGEKRKGQKNKLMHKCTRCGGWGHHKTTCKEAINLQNQSQRSTTSDVRKTRKRKNQEEVLITNTEGGQSHEVCENQGGQENTNWAMDQLQITPVMNSSGHSNSYSPGTTKGKKKPLRGRGVATSSRI